MKQESISALETLKFKQTGITWVGKIQGIMFQVVDKQDSETELSIVLSLAPNENKSRLFQELDKAQTSTEITAYSFDSDVVTVTFNESGTTSLENFLGKIAELLDEVQIKCRCSQCSNTENLAFYSNGSGSLLLCGECAAKIQQKNQEELKAPANYVPGFVGSLIGALVGSAVWVLLGALGFIASIGAAAISFCAFKGYSMMKGRLDKTGIVLNIISIVLAFLFAQYAVLFVEFMKEVKDGSLSLFLAYTPVLFKDPEFIKSMLPDFAFGLLFAFLGSSATIRENIRKARQVEVFHMEKVNLD